MIRKGSSGKTGNIRKRARGKDKLTVNWITPLDSPLVFSSMTRKDTKEGKELLGRDIQGVTRQMLENQVLSRKGRTAGSLFSSLFSGFIIHLPNNQKE